MTEIQVDRLILQVPGLSAANGRRLAERIADGLVAMSGGFETGVLRLDLKAPAGAGVDELARQILAELLMQVRRLP